MSSMILKLAQYLNWITDEIEFFLEGAGVVGNPGKALGESLPLLKRRGLD